MTQPTPKTWTVTAARALPTWGTAVVAGKATIDLFKLTDTPGTGNDQFSIWKSVGQDVSAAEVAAAQAENTASGALPAAYTAPSNTGLKFTGKKRPATAAATDAATTQALANALRADLIALGLKQP